jgi:hypothetical protein
MEKQMTKLEYLKYAMSKGCYGKKAWIISAFGTIKEDPAALTKDPYPGKIVKQAWNYAFINDKNELETITGTSKDSRVLFSFTDRLTIDNTWCGNIRKPTVDTIIGNLLFNLISMVPAFGDKIEFVTGHVSIKAIEAVVASKLRDNPKPGEDRLPEFIYVDEYTRFCNSLTYICGFTQLSCWTATARNIVAPTGVKEFKATLLKKYEGKLEDPVELAKFEDELLKFDSAYLKGDPSDGKFVSGKIRNVARKKMFLSMGSEKNFSGSLKAIPISNSLEEGWPVEKNQFSALMNGLRMGSFSRGADTVKGGVSAKILLRFASTYRITDTDCNTTLGIRRRYSSKDISRLVGRYVLEKSGTILIENKEMASNYLNKDVIVRSPMYCKLESEQICKYCSGTKLAQYPTGLGVPVTEISNILLYAFMGAFHAQVLSTAKLDIQANFN